jgi:ferric-dicitrate binding protein FerR (iron transport regulator)
MDNIKIIPEYAKSKEEIWREKFEHLEKPKGKKNVFKKVSLWAYAASFLIPVLLVCHLHTITEETAKGEHKELKLPDCSIVTMNAESKVSYKPCTWFFTRTVRIEGEACFEVKTGNIFFVKSGFNTVKVFGTTFNIYSRSGTYRVFCVDGQVEVNSKDETIFLTSNMQATLRTPTFDIKSNVTSSVATGWLQGWFVFDETPLREVIAEVERQFNINVAPSTYPNHFFTGNFSNNGKPEEILDIIGLPFGINFSIE